MKSETWTTERGNKVEMNWEVKSNDINVWTEITVLANGKEYKSDGQTDEGKLVIKNNGSFRLVVPAEILAEINETRKNAKANIASSAKEHNDYINRMSEIGY